MQSFNFACSVAHITCVLLSTGFNLQFTHNPKSCRSRWQPMCRLQARNSRSARGTLACLATVLYCDLQNYRSEREEQAGAIDVNLIVAPTYEYSHERMAILSAKMDPN